MILVPVRSQGRNDGMEGLFPKKVVCLLASVPPTMGKQNQMLEFVAWPVSFLPNRVLNKGNIPSPVVSLLTHLESCCPMAYFPQLDRRLVRVAIACSDIIVPSNPHPHTSRWI